MGEHRSALLVHLIRSYSGGRQMPNAEQQPATAQARQFILTTVWQGLSDLADQINAETDRIATLTVDPTAELGKVSLCVYPVGSQPAQAAPLFRYVVAVTSVAAGSRVQFVAQPAVINGQVRSQERRELALTAHGDGRPLTPDRIRDDVARRYQAVMAAQTTRDAAR
jgi:hypothetical protein